MILLFTGSLDGTSDLLVKNLGKDIFRFNFDLFKEYDLIFEPDYWIIKNPAGHKICSTTVTAAFWWKAFNYYLVDEDKFISEEVKYIFRELYNWCQRKGITKGNPHDFHSRLGKMNILNIASQHFHTPKTLACFGLAGTDGLSKFRIVAKSFSSGLTVTNRALMTTEVEVGRLDPDYPWYLQERLEGQEDVTIFICGDYLFSYERDRSNLKGLDWRAEQSLDPRIKEWKRVYLSDTEKTAVQRFCSDINVDWGRLDFMRVKGELIFLEYNANGQWVFLDYQNDHGLLNIVTEYLRDNKTRGII